MISIILPVHNESNNILKNIGPLVEQASSIPGGYEIIIAEDGSTDGTHSLATNLSKQNPGIRVSHSEKRLGKGLAIKKAFGISRGDRIAFVDIDLSADISQLREFAEQDSDIVIGSRLLKDHVARRGSFRHISSVSYNVLVRLFLGSIVRDHQCGFKFFRRGVLEDLISRTQNNRWFFDTELLINARRRGYSIRELPVRWTESKKSKINIKKVTLEMLRDMIRFKRGRQPTSRHLRNQRPCSG